MNFPRAINNLVLEEGATHILTVKLTNCDNIESIYEDVKYFIVNLSGDNADILNGTEIIVEWSARQTSDMGWIFYTTVLFDNDIVILAHTRQLMKKLARRLRTLHDQHKKYSEVADIDSVEIDYTVTKTTNIVSTIKMARKL